MEKFLIGAVALSIASVAGAVTMVSPTVGPDTQPLPAGQTIFKRFLNTDGLSGNYKLVTGSSAGQYAAPLGDTTQYLAVLAGNSATLALGTAATSLSFYWGSIDAYNKVSFFNGATQVASFTGAQIPGATADGNQTSPTDSRRVNFNFGGDKVTSIQFASSANAFELDDVATGTGGVAAVPEPATWALLMVGFGMVGFAARSRRSSSVSA